MANIDIVTDYRRVYNPEEEDVLNARFITK